MRYKISLAIMIVLVVMSLIAVVSKTNTETELLQHNLQTKDQQLKIYEAQKEAINQELEKAKGDSKKLKELEKKNQELQKAVEDAQARKAEKLRIAQAEASNPVQASAQTVSAPVGNVEQIVRDAATKHGIDPDYFVRIAMCESTMNPSAVNYSYAENGNPSGLFQHLSGYWPARAAAHGYAGASVFDAVANANVTASMWASGSHLWECQ
jgi:D-Tyr-tRNAtyr deacylase